VRIAFDREQHIIRIGTFCLVAILASWEISTDLARLARGHHVTMADDLDLSSLQTEAVNGHTTYIDKVSTLEMCAIMNNEDHKLAASVTPCLDDIARAIDLLLPRVRRGGRVIYIGAGTSGR
jgi:hypothetical protein